MPMIRDEMTRDELARALDHLDPGGTLQMEESALAALFGAQSLVGEVTQAVEAFAVEHRCSIAFREVGHTAPCFEKNDVF